MLMNIIKKIILAKTLKWRQPSYCFTLLLTENRLGNPLQWLISSSCGSTWPQTNYIQPLAERYLKQKNKTVFLAAVKGCSAIVKSQWFTRLCRNFYTANQILSSAVKFLPHCTNLPYFILVEPFTVTVISESSKWYFNNYLANPLGQLKISCNHRPQHLQWGSPQLKG